MDIKDTRDFLRFSAEKMQKNSLFASEHLFYDLYCLLPGQSQQVHTHEGSDKVYYVLQGRGSFFVAGEEEEMGEGYAVIARSGEAHGVRNPTDQNLVLLVVMAPKPS